MDLLTDTGPQLGTRQEWASYHVIIDPDVMISWQTHTWKAGCEITGFPAFRDTQKHYLKANFLTRISDWKASKNQVFGKIDSHFQFGKPERFSESQFFWVAF